VSAVYLASGGYIAYCAYHDEARQTIELEVTGSSEHCQVH